MNTLPTPQILEPFGLFPLSALLRMLVRESYHTPYPTSGTLLHQQNSLTLTDTSIFKELLSPQTRSEYFLHGYSGLYALSFSLRHTITQGAALLHMYGTNGSTCREHQELSALFDLDVPQQLRELQGLFRELTRGDLLPVLSFSALGCHLSWQKNGMCRAYDPYHNTCCSSITAADSPFCHLHQPCAWWNMPQDMADAQTIMFAFYGWKEHLFAYTEEQLREEVGKFWHRIGTQQRIAPHLDDGALEVLQIESREALSALGPKGLRRHFLRLARRTHPDNGGDHESFLRLQQAYGSALAFLHAPSP